MLNNPIWHKTESFQFEKSPQEYGFSTRLAYENSWTEDFTQKAILEYKKFMYLVSVNQEMLSPSEIVDIVWHQHLIYSDSYNELCNILGKQIKHLPSTHNSEETHIFNDAFKNTEKKYKEIFGTSGWYLWTIKKDTDLLQLSQKKIKENNLKSYIIISLISLTTLLIFVAKPIFISIPNPYFLIGFYILFILGLTAFMQFIIKYFQKLFIRKENNLISEMNSFELIVIKEKSTQPIINATLWQMITENQLSVENRKINLLYRRISKNPLEKAVRNCMLQKTSISYEKLFQSLTSKNVVKQYSKSTENIINYIKNSKEFQKIKIFSYCFFGLFFSILFSRFYIGESREKPTTFVVISLLILVAFFFYFINIKLNILLRKSIVTIVNQQTSSSVKNNDLGWSFLLFGTTVFGAELISASQYEKISANNSSDSGSSCSSSSSCGSSCSSSSCGGCGSGGD